jgi:hypothetical protein
MAFTLLMQAFTEDFLTPALGAIFAGERGRERALCRLW